MSFNTVRKIITWTPTHTQAHKEAQLCCSLKQGIWYGLVTRKRIRLEQWKHTKLTGKSEKPDINTHTHLQEFTPFCQNQQKVMKYRGCVHHAHTFETRLICVVSIAAISTKGKPLHAWEWLNLTWHTHNSHFFIYSFTKEAEQSREGSRWDKPQSSGHILKSEITLAVWWYFQNTLSSLQHLIKGLLIFSWWSQPSQHLAGGSPPFPVPHNPVKKHTSWL